jgi:hypothetical protein
MQMLLKKSTNRLDFRENIIATNARIKGYTCKIIRVFVAKENC